jgi:Ca2+-binding RTX toxin-like protein
MADFTAREQLMLELINRARMNPSAEADRYNISLNEGVSSNDRISSSPKEVLAGNDKLGTAAARHSQWMLLNDDLDHVETKSTPGFYEKTFTDRISKAGYTYLTGGENIAYIAASGALDLTKTIFDMHRNFFVDAGISGRGHRVNILGEGYREVGIGHEAGTYNGMNASMVTTDFGTRANTVFITGVVYDDIVKDDDFFSVGEQTAGRNVSSGDASDFTGEGGGYELEYVWPGGTKTVTFNLATGSVEAVVALNKTNVKVDVVNGDEIWTNANSLTSLSENVTELHALGIGKVKLIGTDANEKIVGNGGDNKLTGNAGNDNIRGGGGDDKIIGGLGRDKMSGGSSDDKFIFKSAADSAVDAPDLIKDFGDSGTDRIDLHLLGDLTYRDEARFNGTMQVWVAEDVSDVIVHINLSGDKTPEMSIVLDNTSLSSMTSGDFIL